MKISKKEKAFAAVTLSVAISCGVLISVGWGFFLAVVGGVFLVGNKLIKALFRSGAGGRVTDKRNFDCMLLGSTAVWRAFRRSSREESHTISFAFLYRSLAADFLILKHRFSYVREGGVVGITIDCLDLKTSASGTLNPPDLQLCHPIVLKSLGVDRTVLRRKLSFPLLYTPIYATRILLGCVLPAGFLRNNNPRDVESILPLLTEIVTFCQERNLEPQIFFFNARGMGTLIEKWVSSLCGCHNDIRITVLEDERLFPLNFQSSETS